MTSPNEHFVTAYPPPRGVAVLMCRCGTALDMEQMYRYVPPRSLRSKSVLLRQICCLDCATADLEAS